MRTNDMNKYVVYCAEHWERHEDEEEEDVQEKSEFEQRLLTKIKDIINF